MPTFQDIPFREIPRQSALFLDYLDCSPKALRFYRIAPSLEGIRHAADALRTGNAHPRAEMARILRRQNESFGAGPETFRQIGELEKDDCVAVLTGQQVGLFTGPLYTIYKALTALQIARELTNLGIRAVPVFWLETEDHDLKEAMHLSFLDRDAGVSPVNAGALLENAGTHRGSVGHTPIPDAIRQVVSDYTLHLPDGAWKPEIEHRLNSAYAPGSTYGRSFARLLAHVFRGTGLILFDPHDLEAKRLLSPVFRKALIDSDAMRAALIQRSRELQSAGYHAQVNVLENSTTLFLSQDGARHALEKKSSDFCLKNTGFKFSLDELLNRAETQPEIFSPNVLLRPVIQDHLFPTIAYVGGSSEVAYFAQIETLYSAFKRFMPAIWPRNSFTLIDPEIRGAMERTGIAFGDCFMERRALIEKAVRRMAVSDAARDVDELREQIDEGLTTILPDFQAADPTLASALENARRKILHNVQHLKSAAARLAELRDTLTAGAVDLLRNNCYPNENLQERELGICHFWARSGYSVLDAVRSCLDIRSFAHRVIYLDSNETNNSRG
jgi:bacillithiol biosynthesis cysteine-adding enzyme BshC